MIVVHNKNTVSAGHKITHQAFLFSHNLLQFAIVLKELPK